MPRAVREADFVMKTMEDCVRRIVPAHWVTEVEASEWEVNMLAYPAQNSRYTLVVGAWVALLDGGHEVMLDGSANVAHLVDSIERANCTVAADATNEQLAFEF